MLHKFLIIFVFAAVLSACGGGGSGLGQSVAPTPTPEPVVTPTPIPTPAPFVAPVVHFTTPATRILIFGDSTMAFGGYSEQPDSVYLSQLAGIPVDNLAISGTTIDEMLNGHGAYTQPMMVSLAANAADVVIENYGINDTLAEKGESFETYIADVNAYIDQVRAAGKIPVIEEPNPTCGAGGMYTALAQRVEAINHVAATKGVLVIHQFYTIQQIPNWCSMYEQYGVHPLTALTKIKAQNEYDQLKAAGLLGVQS